MRGRSPRLAITLRSTYRFSSAAVVRNSLAAWGRPYAAARRQPDVERWSQPGLLLLGDAAHPMSPAGGQGINVAIYDSVVAARRLVPALVAHSPLDG